MTAIGTATYGRPAYYDLVAPPLVSTCPQGCPCPRHWPQADPWAGAPLVPPLPRRIRGAR